jgi:hypothetical protein
MKKTSRAIVATLRASTFWSSALNSTSWPTMGAAILQQ